MKTSTSRSSVPGRPGSPRIARRRPPAPARVLIEGGVVRHHLRARGLHAEQAAHRGGRGGARGASARRASACTSRAAARGWPRGHGAGANASAIASWASCSTMSSSIPGGDRIRGHARFVDRHTRSTSTMAARSPRAHRDRHRIAPDLSADPSRSSAIASS